MNLRKGAPRGLAARVESLAIALKAAKWPHYNSDLSTNRLQMTKHMEVKIMGTSRVKPVLQLAKIGLIEICKFFDFLTFLGD